MVSKGRKNWVVRDGSGILVCIYGVLEGGRDGRKSPGRSPYPNIVTSLVIDPPSPVEQLEHFSSSNRQCGVKVPFKRRPDQYYDYIRYYDRFKVMIDLSYDPTAVT